jgi:hypothetical protein
MTGRAAARAHGTFVDAAGLQGLLHALKRLPARGRRQKRCADNAM